MRQEGIRREEAGHQVRAARALRGSRSARPASRSAGTTTLSLTYVGPEPDTVTVPWGDTLRITNADTVAHSLVSSHPELRTGVLLPGKTFTATISGPAHNYGFRQTGGTGFPGKVEVDFRGHVSSSPSSFAVNFGRRVRLKGTTNLHSTPVVLQVHRSGDSHWTTAGDGLQQRLRATTRPPSGCCAAASCAPPSAAGTDPLGGQDSSTCGRS